MRVKFIGLDKRTRVSKASSIKFVDDGFQDTDKQIEWDERVGGPALVVHLYRMKGGKRLTMEVPDNFNMAAAERQILEAGWLDLSDCVVKSESLY